MTLDMFSVARGVSWRVVKPFVMYCDVAGHPVNVQSPFIVVSGHIFNYLIY